MALGHQLWPKPEDLLRQLGITDAREIELEAIAQYCGATIVYEPLHGCEARLLAHRDRAIITVDPDSHHHRKRFSAAHELGHWMLDRHQAGFACTQAMMAKSWSTALDRQRQVDPEARANRWAADLLMPEYLFGPLAEDSAITLDAARDLTRIFGTSLIATALRLIRFGSASSMLIWSRPGQRYKWFRSSPRFPAALWPRPEPGPETVAYRLLRGFKEKRGPALVKWDQWVDLPNPWQSFVREDSMRMRNGEVLTLLEWDDETPLDDFLNQQPLGRRHLVGERGRA